MYELMQCACGAYQGDPCECEPQVDAVGTAHRLFIPLRQRPGNHGGDCDGTLCDTCGCCQHCDPIDCGCAMGSVATPFELTCPGTGCDCRGGGAGETR